MGCFDRADKDMANKDQNPEHPFDLLCGCKACQEYRDALRVQEALARDDTPGRTRCDHEFYQLGERCPGCRHDAGPWEVDPAPAVFDTAVFADSTETASPDD